MSYKTFQHPGNYRDLVVAMEGLISNQVAEQVRDRSWQSI